MAIDIISSYKNYKGETILVRNENGSFGVFIRNGPAKCWEDKDFDSAVDRYKECIDSLNEKIAPRKCSFNPKNVCMCKAKHCPKKLGGEDYWRLFREACLYRTK